MFQLIYTSEASPALTHDALRDIAAQARRANEADGITGVLMMADGRLMQLIEGSEDKVRALYRRILRDERHTDCEILVTRECDQRLFGDWSLLLAEPDEDSFKLGIVVSELRQHRDSRPPAYKRSA